VSWQGGDDAADDGEQIAGNRADRLDWILVCALALFLTWIPLPFGSNIPLAWGANAVLFCALTAAFEISRLVARRSHPVGLSNLAVPGALFVGVLVWILIQRATWTPASWHHPIWDLAADALERPARASISVNRDLTALALMRLLTAASVFWLAVQLCRDEARAAFLVAAIGVAISAYAAYGIAVAVAAPGQVLWLDVRTARGFVTSTFINRNTFATFAGLGFLIGCGLLIDHYRGAIGAVRGPLAYKIASFLEATGLKVAILLGAAVVNFAALSLTGSRGAMLATLLAFAVLNGLAFVRSAWRALGVAAVLAVGLVIVLVSGLADPFIRSLAERGFYDANRMSVYALVAGSILDEPVLGYGYGTFPDLFPMLRDRSVAGFNRWEMAHNVYLEVFQELGLIFGAALIGCVAWLVARCAKGAVIRHKSAMIPAIAASAAVLVGVHALVDFSLQVQAVTLTFFAILGAGVAQSASSRRMIGD
jgi:O-antigen ligase